MPTRLRDHGCEIIGGLGLLLGVESQHHPEKAKVYLPAIRMMLDEILERGTNEDGIMFDQLGNPKSRLSDGWGYNYVTYLCHDRVYMGFKKDWPRMNTLPEWFTVDADKQYMLTNLTTGGETSHTGKLLHEGVSVQIPAGTELRLQLRPSGH